MNRLCLTLAALALTTPAVAQPAVMRTRQQCQDVLEYARRSGIIVDQRMNGGTVEVVVRDQPWKDLPYAAKREIVDNLNCFLLPHGGSVQLMQFLSVTTNKLVGSFNGFELTIP